jgi:hypothetical protein
MDWTRSETLVLASNSCSYCRGLGMKGMLRGEDKPCECVFRSIFRVCLRRFVLCATKEKNLSNVTYERHGAAGRGGSWGRKDEEYIADFLASAERTLEPLEQKVFRFYFLLGADWKLCARKLNMDRGTFFHAVYRIEKKLGKEFAEVQPYPLYPLARLFQLQQRTAGGACVRPHSPRSESAPDSPAAGQTIGNGRAFFAPEGGVIFSM